MKTLFYVLILSMLAASANAQWIRVTNLHGTTAHYGTVGCATDVTVTGAGAFTSSASATWACGFDPYHIGVGSGWGSPLPGSYTYAFSSPVSRIRIRLTHSHIGEIIHIRINALHYTLTLPNMTPSGLPIPSCTDGTWPGDFVITPGGDLRSTGTGSSGASAIITIDDVGCINLLEVSTNGIYNGTSYSLEIQPTGTSIAGAISGPGSICGSATATYTGSGVTVGCGATESWTSSNPSVINFATPSSGAATISNVCPSTEVVITHLFTDGCATASTSTTVTVNPSPVFTLTYAPNPLCSGDPYTMSCNPTPCSGETYTSISWTGSGFTGSGTPVSRPGVFTSSGISLPYHATVINNYGCPATKMLVVDVNPKPVITPVPARVCLGDTRTFNVQPSVSGGTWGSFDPTIAPVVVSGLMTGDVTGNNVGTTVITYTSPMGCKGTTNVTVMPVPTATLTATPPVLCGPGTSVLSAAISYTGTGTLHFWWDDLTVSTGFPGLTYLASLTSTTTYLFTVTDGICSTTMPITVTVNPVPTVSVAYTGCTPPCPSTPLTYAVHGGAGVIVDYAWSDPCGGTGTGSVTLDGSGNGVIALASGPCEGLFHLTIMRVYDPATDCTNYDGYSLQPLDLRRPFAMFCTDPLKKCCGWIDFGICGTPGSTAYVEPMHTPVLIGAGGFGTLHIWLCDETTLTIGNVTGPCCSYYSGSTYTYTPLTPGAPPTVVCHVDPVDGNFVYWFDISGIGASDAVTIDFTEHIFCLGGSGTTPTPSSLSGAGPGPYYVPMLPYPCFIVGIDHVTITVNGCTWVLGCAPWSSKPGGNNDENALAPITAGVSVIPNPNVGSFTISGSLPSVKTSKEATIEVTDLLGKTIYTDVAAMENGGINKEVSLGSEVANGIYIVRIKNKEVNEVIKFTLDR